jgi:hypothetical protein
MGRAALRAGDGTFEQFGLMLELHFSFGLLDGGGEGSDSSFALRPVEIPPNKPVMM